MDYMKDQSLLICELLFSDKWTMSVQLLLILAVLLCSQKTRFLFCFYVVKKKKRKNVASGRK